MWQQRLSFWSCTWLISIQKDSGVFCMWVAPKFFSSLRLHGKRRRQPKVFATLPMPGITSQNDYQGTLSAFHLKWVGLMHHGWHGNFVLLISLLSLLWCYMENFFLQDCLWRLFIANKYMEKKESKKKKNMLWRRKAPSKITPLSFLVGEFGAVWLWKYAS